MLFLLLFSLSGAFRGFAPALVLSILDPKLTWSEAEQQAAVQQVGGAGEGELHRQAGRQHLGEGVDAHAATSRLEKLHTHCLHIHWRALGMCVDTRCTHLLLRSSSPPCPLCFLQGVVVRKSDGSGLSPYDLKRLQVGLLLS